MKLEDIIALGKMGFTKDDILKLTNNADSNTNTEKEKPVETKQNAEATAEAKNFDLETALKPIVDRLDLIEQRTKTNNIIGTSINADTEDAFDILAKIINP